MLRFTRWIIGIFPIALILLSPRAFAVNLNINGAPDCGTDPNYNQAGVTYAISSLSDWQALYYSGAYFNLTTCNTTEGGDTISVYTTGGTFIGRADMGVLGPNFGPGQYITNLDAGPMHAGVWSCAGGTTQTNIYNCPTFPTIDSSFDVYVFESKYGIDTTNTNCSVQNYLTIGDFADCSTFIGTAQEVEVKFGSSLAISLSTPQPPIYIDFPTWGLAVQGTIGHTIEYDIQYDTADDLGGGYCSQSPGAIDSATTTLAAATTTLNLNKATAISPLNWFGTFSNPVNGNGYPTTIYYKTCAADLTGGGTFITTSSFIMNFGAAQTNTGGTTTTIAFSYPTSTTAVYPPFAQVVMQAQGIASSTIYTLHSTIQVAGVTQIYGGSTQYTGSRILSGGLGFPNPIVGIDFGNASSVPVTISTQLTNFNGLLASASGTFTMLTWSAVNSSGTIVNPNGTTTEVFPTPEIINGNFTGQATTTISGAGMTTNVFSQLATCPTPGSWTDIGGGIAYGFCEVANILFIPNQNAVTYVGNGFDDLKQDFPFDAVYGTLGIFSNAAQGVQYGTLQNDSSTDPRLDLTLWGAKIPIMNSSTLSGFLGVPNKNMIFQTETAAAWVGVAWTIIKVIF